MSNPIRYDPLLVRHLARELDTRFRGTSARAIRLDPESRRAAVELDSGALVFELDPAHGFVGFGPARAAERVYALRSRATIGAITSAPDERRLVIPLASTGPGGDRPRQVVVELMTNHWNLLVLGDDDRILDVLWPRTVTGRVLRASHVYAPPPLPRRRGIDAPLDLDEWLTLLEPVPPGERVRRLLAEVAWTSAINAAPILGTAAYEEAGRPGDATNGERASRGTSHARDALVEAHARYHALVAALLAPAADEGEGEPERETVRGAWVLPLKGGEQPYPHHLWISGARQCPSLLDAIAAVAGSHSRSPVGEGADQRVPGAISPELLAAIERRIDAIETRISRLESELADAEPEANRLRASGDLILARMEQVRKGMRRATLTDFSGNAVEIELDPALSPADNAKRYYDAARRRARAAARLPELISAARAEVAELRDLLRRAATGAVDENEVRTAIGAPSADGDGKPRVGQVRRLPEPAALPYRRYRSSGGYEIRVGRGGRQNDELTFHHSAPNDIWLHARDVAGAHVILRWPSKDANPPARDLMEAAVLAGLHSRARTSKLVPVDWTRRKYVRKPRNAPPGLVTAERLKTVFVEPDASLEERLRVP